MEAEACVRALHWKTSCGEACGSPNGPRSCCVESVRVRDLSSAKTPLPSTPSANRTRTQFPIPIRSVIHFTYSSSCDVVMFRVEDVYRRVEQAGGEAHFDRSRSSPFKYVSVLICLQRLGAAVAYLWRGGRVDEAIHLTVLGLYYGLLAPQESLDSSPTSFAAPSPVDMIRLWIRHNINLLPAPIAANYVLCLGCAARGDAECFRDMDKAAAERCRIVSLQSQSDLLEELLTSVDRHQVRMLFGDFSSLS